MTAYEYACIECKIIYIKDSELDEDLCKYTCDTCASNLIRTYYNTDKRPAQAGFYSINKECQIKK
jgi:hypothetical protein